MKSTEEIQQRIDYLENFTNNLTCETLIGSRVKLMIREEIVMLENIINDDDWCFTYDWVFDEIKKELDGDPIHILVSGEW